MLHNHLTHGSLFSGIGGFDLAAMWAGWQNVFQCEKNEWCQRILKQHFPQAKQFNDIHEFDATPYKGAINVISGGFPCQPFSIAGKQAGKTDDHYLWPQMLRIIKEVEPAYVVCENVPGIINMALDQVLSDLENAHYTTETFVIPACSKNAWHKRDRVWIIAYTNTNSARFNKQRSTITNEAEYFAPQCSSWWQAEPGVGRVVDGVPHRVDRIKGLGNAIVPQVAFEIFTSINQIELNKQ